MDHSTTIPLRTGSKISDTWRLAISLATALGVHIALITIPVSLTPGSAASNKSLLKIILLSGENTETSPAPDTDHFPAPSRPDAEARSKSALKPKPPSTAGTRTTPPKPRKLERRSAEKSNKAGGGRLPAPSPPDVAAQSKSTLKPEIPSTAGTRPMDMPADSGAKSRSTVFDPKLEKKLARARNKVPKFKSGDVVYMTTTGTFVQQGDRCWDVKKLSPNDTSSEARQWFRIKCPRTSKPKSDIDRLAEKYGIP